MAKLNTPMNAKKRKDECFYIGDGAIVMKDLCIPLDAISSIDVVETPKIAINAVIVFAILGIVLLIPDNGVIRILGVLMLLYAGTMGVIIYLAEKNKEHSLKIQVASGRIITFSSKDLNFLRELMEMIYKSIEDKGRITYVNMIKNNFTQNIEKIEAERIYQQNINSGNVIGGNWDMGGNNSTFVNNGESASFSNMNNGNVSILTRNEWNELENFFARRGREIGRAGLNYDACVKLQEFSRNRDAKGMKAFMKEIGGTVVKAILGAAAEGTVTALLAKILRMG